MAKVGPNQETHEIFKPKVEESQQGVEFVGDIYRDLGWEVRIPPIEKSDKVEDRMDFSDKGDMFISAPGIAEQCIEVKHLGYYFTCNNWPFKEYYVCNKHSFDSRIVKPVAYISLNCYATYWGMLSVSTSDQWYEKLVKEDRNYPGHELPQMKYVAETALAKFWEIPKKYLDKRREFFGDQVWIK